jgi:hypothetical protein
LEWTPVHGSAAPADRRILVFTRLVRQRLWLQPGEVEADQDGRWAHPRVNLHASQERYVYALAVAPESVPLARSLFGPDLTSVVDLQQRLRASGTHFALSEPKLLNRIADPLHVTLS